MWFYVKMATRHALWDVDNGAHRGALVAAAQLGNEMSRSGVRR